MNREALEKFLTDLLEGGVIGAATAVLALPTEGITWRLAILTAIAGFVGAVQAVARRQLAGLIARRTP